MERQAEGLPPDRLAEKIFAGRILIFDALPSVRELVGAARGLLEDIFGGAFPPTAFETFGHEEYRRRLKRARSRFMNSDVISSLYREAILSAGADLETTYIDKLALRCSPPYEAEYAPGFGALPPHRDSWGSGLDCQINWWLPFYEIAEGRTMAIFPRCFNRHVRNDSAGWDWRRATTEPDYPILPSALQPPDWREAVHVVIPPGSLMAFSGSHLHATVRNATGQARISSDTRTVDLAHLQAGRGAPNADRGNTPPNLEWFCHIGSGSCLTGTLERDIG